jgi:hypothetical protein
MIDRTSKPKSSYQRLKEAGLCVYCQQPRGKKGTTIYCRKCAEKERERTRQRLAKRVEQGLCVRCGKPRGKNSTLIHCRKCADKLSEYRRNYKSEARS